MKTLHDHVIIYDAECPLCNLYTGAFVKTGMLDQNGRAAYHEVCHQIDFDKSRARNEIALVNRANGEVVYGLDSLLKIIENRFPFFKSLFQVPLFQKAMKSFYSFISFNRKVIAPGRGIVTAESCVPDFNTCYRWAYIILCWIVSSLVLQSYASLLQHWVGQTNFFREFLICGGQILFQMMVARFVFRLNAEAILIYLGNMMTISLIGSLLLLPSFLISNVFSAMDPIGFLIWFVVIVGAMFLEHARRIKILKLPAGMSLSWVVYRVLVLIAIV